MPDASAPTPADPEAHGASPAPASRSTTRSVAVALLAILAIVAASAGLRIGWTLQNPHFDATSSEGFLTTDPAFITYGAARIVAGGGFAPDDFRADPRVEHPDRTDMPAMFTIGQEYLIAWLHLALEGDVPLHVCAVWIMGILAALTGLGVALLTAELCGRIEWGILAALCWAALPASYRTLGFVVVREDLSLPLWALHLWFCARAYRTDRVRDCVGAGLLAGAAAATWHAMGSFLTMELACGAAWFARTGRSALGSPRAVWAPVAATAVGLAVPVLRAKGFWLSVPLVLAWSLVLVGWLGRKRGLGRATGLGVFAGAVVVLAGAGFALGELLGTGGDYAHVGELLRAKLAHWGRRPLDPTVLTFDTRLMWQGPFNTADANTFFVELGLVLVALPLALVAALPTWWRGRGDERLALFALLFALGLVTTWLIQRTMVLPAVVGSAVLVATLARLGRRGVLLGGVALAVGCALLLFATEASPPPPPRGQPPETTIGLLLRAMELEPGFVVALSIAALATGLALRKGLVLAGSVLVVLSVVAGEGWVTRRYKIANESVWYASPELVTTAERAQLVRWVRQNVPPDEPIAADFMTSAGLLLHTGHPVLLQPKYETTRSRRRIEAFFEHFYRGTPESLRDWMDEHGCRTLVVDRPWMRGNRNLAGIPMNTVEPPAGSPARWILSFVPDQFTRLPGFDFLYGSAPKLRTGLHRQRFPPPGFVVYRAR